LSNVNQPDRSPDPIAVEDVQAIVRLLSSAVDVRGDLAARRRHVVEGLAQLVGADVWLWVQSKATGPGGLPVLFFRIHGGLRDEREHALIIESSEAPERDVFIGGFVHDIDVRRHVTRTRRQAVSDEAWYGSAFYRKYVEPLGLDDFILSPYLVGGDGGVVTAVALYRRREHGVFGERERAIVHVVTGQVDWLHREGNDVPAAGRVAGLSPRQRQVMWFLVAGYGRKQVAAQLGISEHTVNDYAKALHRHFGVSSRGELVAKFISGAGPTTT
jgi:DNA-binding CsgD family transcriptional regulator